MLHRPRLSLPGASRASGLKITISETLFRPLQCAPKKTFRAAHSQDNGFRRESVADTITPPPSRWISDVRSRVGKCLMFGCNPEQVRRAAAIMAVIGKEWRTLSAGSDGFLVGECGLENQQVLWGEMDSFGHVNNTHYNRWAETSRVNWTHYFGRIYPYDKARWAGLMTPKEVGLIMKSIKTDYKFPVTYPDTFSAYHKLSIKPEREHTSLFLEGIIFSHRHQRVAARLTEDITIYDYQKGVKTTLPTFTLGPLDVTWYNQEEAIIEARRKISMLLEDVRDLERETWDREDAVEDLGGAGDKK
ncbi:thioesterase-like superfamily-domain-containing protein [Xylariaceae sp. FL1272]|nr:thioesterase-like superfamily-domain-containing protein [Xylariaceae sp. FL1272]